MPEYLVEMGFRQGEVTKGFYVVADSGAAAADESRRKYPEARVERVVEVPLGCDEAGRTRRNPEAGRL